jgi:hypothetical protein
MAKKTPTDNFAIARRYVQTMHTFVKQHPARSREELDLLANAALMFATQLAFPTGSKFTFTRQAQLCWDKYDKASKNLEKMGAGATIHPEGAERSNEPGYVPICRGDHLVHWTNDTTYHCVVVMGFTKKYVHVAATPLQRGGKIRLVKASKLGMDPELLEMAEKDKAKIDFQIDDADSCRAEIERFNAAIKEALPNE